MKKLDDFLAMLRENYTCEGKPLKGRIIGHSVAFLAALYILSLPFRWLHKIFLELGADNFTTIVTILAILAICIIVSGLKRNTRPPLAEGCEPYIIIKRELQHIFFRLYQESKSVAVFVLREQLDPDSISIALHSDGKSVCLQLNKQPVPVGEPEIMAFSSFLRSRLSVLDNSKTALFRGYNVQPQIAGVEDGGTVWRVYVRLL